MEVSNKDSENDMSKPLNGLGDAKNVNVISNGEEEEDDDEGQALLPKEGALSEKCDKKRRKVQWNDRNGDKLAEILEFEPSEVGDSDDEESDSCLCRIM
ncbi:hypothetical protein Leryth_006309 [Lithospermum erythrorhizon]|nr:hypothetical protein Leryth_006309 [Lithospermum erythrorhizon]